MKFRLGPLASDILIFIYATGSLYLRFKFESQTPISPLNSIVMGVCFVVVIWALIKLKVLNPNWFGLFNSKKAQ
ncbi:hypothetical protein GZ212_14880 [Mangrovimonas sp. CR14]|uniref:hypothetical protein n=1 Tax=Mangrovimonas sp. CR14 TaxID=2706120 RepID=UPI00141FB67C|nr:hypothetical protein [Mangrovimonas sp. CR14]NIK93445.1 hypothetical protein [Mangrovimonas sp. CR14]